MRFIAALSLFVTVAQVAFAQHAHEGSASRPDDHAPIGMMADHTHHAGEWMLSYRYMFMSMDGNRSGTEEVDEADVLDDYMVSPLNMSMQMHMFGAMYAPTDRLTLAAMLPLVLLDMDHRTRMGDEFTTSTSGLGDISLTALIPVLRRGAQQTHVSLRAGFPTASIDETGDTPAGDGQQLPYPMQLGSGSFALSPGLTWVAQGARASGGAQLTGEFFLNDNDADYRLGNRAELNAWGAFVANDWWSLSLRGRYWNRSNIEGSDDRLNPMMVPTADPDLRGGSGLDAALGVNLLVQRGALKGQRLAVEFGLPIVQDLDGPQLQNDWSLVAGWQASWPH